ncbi:MAG: hypothetical protein M1823_004265 [Watsoniomyces obsoletus]|nr:MAG: hypothetical protein M1823_004265 [Watsoniomyces obsoletus]
MVCTKCQRLLKATELATPGVKRKSEIYYGSNAGGKSGSASTGVAKSKLLSKSAKNPYAAYSSSCDTCKTKTDQGRKLCQKCAYKANACAMCGKSQSRQKDLAGGSVVQGQKFSAK